MRVLKTGVYVSMCVFAAACFGVLVFWGVLRNLSLEVGGVTKFVTCETQNEIRGGSSKLFKDPSFSRQNF